MTRTLHVIALLAVPLILIGCGGGGGGNGDDDTTTDTVEDGVEDAIGEVSDDAVEETVDDPAEDLVPDVPAEVTEDAPEDSPTSGIVGDACTVADDCGGIPATNIRCLEILTGGPGTTITFPEGYCSAACTEDGDCGGDATCERFGPDLNLCLDACESDTDCRESDGYECRARMGGSDTFCLPVRG